MAAIIFAKKIRSTLLTKITSALQANTLSV